MICVGFIILKKKYRFKLFFIGQNVVKNNLRIYQIRATKPTFF